MNDAMVDQHPFAVALLAVDRVGTRLVATLTIRNTSQDRPVELVRYGVPAGGQLDAPQFLIQGRGGVAPFKGPLIKRPEPTASDYVVIAPSRGIKSQVDLTELFHVDLASPMRIQYGFHHPTLSGPQALYLLRSNAVQLA